MEDKKEVIIQKKIEEAISNEFEILLQKQHENELLKIIISGEINNLSLDEIKNRIREGD